MLHEIRQTNNFAYFLSDVDPGFIYVKLERRPLKKEILKEEQYTCEMEVDERPLGPQSVSEGVGGVERGNGEGSTRTNVS